LVLLCSVLNAAIHEAGHAVAVILAGGKVEVLQPWFFLGRVHCQHTEVPSGAWRAFVAMSGMLLCVIVGIIGSIVVALGGVNKPFGKIGVLFFVPLLSQSLAWVILPLLIMLGLNEPKDDVVTFIYHSGWSPFAVFCLGLCLVGLIATLLAWIYKRKPANQNMEPTVNLPVS